MLAVRIYVMEFFGWRDFHNRREACGERSRTIGALAGLTPTPFQSGGEDHEQGTPALHRWFVPVQVSAKRATP